MLRKLSDKGVAGFVLANGAIPTSTKGEGEIRQKLIENDLIDCMIALPGQLFYTTQIQVCLCFMSKNKKEDKERGYRDRQGETLFIDARKMGTMVDRTLKELSKEDLKTITDTYHSWRSNNSSSSTNNAGESPALPGYEDMAKHNYVLTLGRYVGPAELEDDGISFETKMKDLSSTLYGQMKESTQLDSVIKANLKELGYGE